MSAQYLHPRHWLTWIAVGLLRASGWLPLPALLALGALVGMVFERVSVRRRRTAWTNIARCFPDLSADDQRERVATHFRAFGKSFLTTGIAWWGSAQRVRRVVELRGAEYLERAMAQKRNVILLAPHFVGLEIGGIRVSVDWPMVTVFAEPKNVVIAEIMRRARMRFRMQTMAGHRAPLLQLVRTVARGTPLYYLPDQNPHDRHFVFAPFFGHAAATYTTLARMAQMTQALVIPCVTYLREDRPGFETVLGAPLVDFPCGDPVADATRMNRVIEELIAPYPAQYQWCYKRFKTRPPGEAKFY